MYDNTSSCIGFSNSNVKNGALNFIRDTNFVHKFNRRFVKDKPLLERHHRASIACVLMYLLIQRGIVVYYCLLANAILHEKTHMLFLLSRCKISEVRFKMARSLNNDLPPQCIAVVCRWIAVERLGREER